MIRGCATDLPNDVEAALEKAADAEDGIAREVLGTLLANIKIARSKSLPMCQDTGTLIFYVTCPKSADKDKLREIIIESVREATYCVPLRANAVDALSGVNSGDNTGLGVPAIHFSEWDRDTVKVELMLKGGGSENVTQLYKLPDMGLNAHRDLNGVVKCVLDAVYKAQGRGCPPYVIGVGIGGLADGTLDIAKRQLMREINDVNPDAALANLETELLAKVNSLGIGPGGLGGKTTALAVKAAAQHCHPASYIVGVSFMCWACRRRTIEVEM